MTTEAAKARMRAYRAKRYRARKAAGLCNDCPEPAIPGTSRCPACRLRGDKSSAECHRRKQREKGVKPRRKRPERAAHQQGQANGATAQATAAKYNHPIGPMTWRESTLRDCLDYDPTSGPKEECWGGAPTPQEIALHQASFIVARTDARGCERPGVVFVDKAPTTSVGLPDLAAGDQGQRYMVSAWDPVTELRFTFGWADFPKVFVMAEVIRRYTRYRDVEMVDRA